MKPETIQVHTKLIEDFVKWIKGEKDNWFGYRELCTKNVPGGGEKEDDYSSPPCANDL